MTQPSCEQRHRAPSHQRPAERVVDVRQAQGALGEFGRGRRVCGTQRFGGIAKSGDRQAVARFCALSQLGGHLDRQRAACQEYVDAPTIQGA